MCQRIALYLAMMFGAIIFTVEAASLSFPEELIPLKVNGMEVEHSLFSKQLDFELPKGTHKIQIKYSDLYELDYDEHQTVSSAPFWVEVMITQPGKYSVGFDRASSVDAAEKFALSPSIYVISPNQSKKSNLKVMTEPRQVSVMAASKQTAPSKAAPKSRKYVEGVTHPNAELMLQYWWHRADEKQRAAFLNAVIVN